MTGYVPDVRWRGAAPSPSPRIRLRAVCGAAKQVEERRAGLPVNFAWCSYEAATCWIAVSIELAALGRHPIAEQDLVRQVADVLFNSHVAWLVPRVLLVADDVDITDIDQLVWATATRYRPAMGEYAFRDAPGFPLVPYLTDDDVAAGRGGKAEGSPSPAFSRPSNSPPGAR